MMTQRLDGQIALVTGGTDGIGLQTAIRLAQMGAQGVLVGRDAEKGRAAIARIHAEVPGSVVDFQAVDLSEMQGVRAFAQRFASEHPHLDILVHCAGVMLRTRTLTREGLETVFAVQFLARMLLTQSLITALEAAPLARVVDVSAGGTINMKFDWDNLQGEAHYDGANALKHESVANDILIVELQARHPDIAFYNYGPDVVRTGLLRDMPAGFRLFAKAYGQVLGISPEQAADDIAALLTDGKPGGLYSRKGKHNPPSAFKADAANRSRLWTISETLIEGALNNGI